MSRIHPRQIIRTVRQILNFTSAVCVQVGEPLDAGLGFGEAELYAGVVGGGCFEADEAAGGQDGGFAIGEHFGFAMQEAPEVDPGV